MQSVIDYRPSHGGGLDYHNSPLIGEIPATDLYHMHRSIDQLRSLNERGSLNHIATSMNNTDLKTTASAPTSASAALQLEYKLYNNNNNNAHEHNHQSHHDNGMEYLKSDVSALIDEQNDKIDSVLKQVEKHEIDSAYNASSISPSSTPPPVPLTDGRGRKKGSKKVRDFLAFSLSLHLSLPIVNAYLSVSFAHIPCLLVPLGRTISFDF